MRTFIQKQNEAQQQSSSNIMRPSAVHHAKSHPTHPILQLQRTIGNQAVQRMLQAKSNGSGSGLQFQSADADSGISPTPAGTWDPMIAFHIWLENEGTDCDGWADQDAMLPYSRCGSPIKAPFCRSAGSRFNVIFRIDLESMPRPQPFKPPAVSVLFRFTPAGGSRGRITHDVNESDSAPRYPGPGKSLEPKFGRDFPFSTTESGKLAVRLTMDDMDSGVKVKYEDSIDYVVEPCV
jgi:hypothetical protein